MVKLDDSVAIYGSEKDYMPKIANKLKEKLGWKSCKASDDGTIDFESEDGKMFRMGTNGQAYPINDTIVSKKQDLDHSVENIVQTLGYEHGFWLRDKNDKMYLLH